MQGYIALLMFPALFVLLPSGYPVAFILGAVALFFGTVFLDGGLFGLLPLRIWGIMTNFTLLAVPLFIFMGTLFQNSGVAARLLTDIGSLCGQRRGGLAVAVMLIGGLLGATTGIVGATVVTMGLISLPVMLRHGYSTSLAAGTIATAGTFGQIIPPSIILILLGDIMGVPVGRLFIGALLPGFLLLSVCLLYIVWVAWRRPQWVPPVVMETSLSPVAVWCSLLPPFLLVLIVLGSIFAGVASPTESAAFGAVGALLLTVKTGRCSISVLRRSAQQTMRMTSMVFLILIGATAFGLVFRGMGGDATVRELIIGWVDGPIGFLLISMALIFILGLFLDFLEISFIIVPILVPIAAYFNVPLLYLALLIAVNLQISFLTPPFGFSLFYLKGAMPKLPLPDLYKGVLPFVILEVLVLVFLMMCPECVLWLPNKLDEWRGL